MMTGKDNILKFVGDQLSVWPLACGNFRSLRNTEIRTMEVGGLTVRLQHNPARIVSSAADTAPQAIRERRCFLCAENRPKEQMSLPYEGRKGKKYSLLVNPYPIFQNHIVIAGDTHSAQSIAGRYVDMLDLARSYQGFTFFYNGPQCGASAPDHIHFQGCERDCMPLESDVEELLNRIPRDAAGNYVFEADDAKPWRSTLRYLTSVQDAHLYHYDKFARGIFVIRGRTVKSSAKMLYRLLDCAEVLPDETEPRFNLMTYYSGGEYRSIVIFRSCHRSSHYYSSGEDHLTMSPGCADMGGLFIVPVAEDYHKLTPELLRDMLDQVTLAPEKESRIIWKLTRTQPLLSVGVLSAPEIEFEMISDGAGKQKAFYREGKIDYNGALYDELFFDAQTPSTMLAEPTFVLHNVVIGVGFHWERKETQKFAGSLKIIVEHNHLVAVNLIGVEDYLVSVISSEMKSTSSLEFLKAHAVISRSWVMAQIASRKAGHRTEVPQGVDTTPGIVTWLDIRRNTPSCRTADNEIIKWYDHDDHKNFDVCADDHCQRYQGLTRAVGETVRTAVDATWGQVLTSGGEICDARFSKCCGGVTERFSSCWADRDYPYLRVLPDTPGHNPSGEAFCNTSDKAVLSQVLNSYDRETPDFYEWKEEMDLDELSERIARKSGIFIGRLKNLRPLERGGSGRITRLEVIGDQRSFVVGKELEIRRILSESHLKSSCFDVDMKENSVVLHGRGWGHGVGLCQIGAAVMASKGYGYREILEHYYPGAEIGNE